MSNAHVTGGLANQNLVPFLNLFIQQLQQQTLLTSTTLIPLVTNTTSSIPSSSTTIIPTSSNTNTKSQTVNNNNNNISNNNTNSYLSYPITKRTSLSEIDQISNESFDDQPGKKQKLSFFPNLTTTQRPAHQDSDSIITIKFKSVLIFEKEYKN